ncbi:unnamed protein product [Soboliphyme baturini]|uniref:Low-density lipoprotein receptor domain class A n=1 Tax=Soboliphyme baturini TaxID=241478 RepID=A0A183J087_9BILA|nr:unnamed protein product [Soboliphyme baturini]
MWHDVRTPLNLIRENPCGWNNGHCSQLCLLAPATEANGPRLNATCVCADGYVRNKDHQSCREDCNENQIACHEPAVKCISKVYWCDGISHCLEGEDEDDCPRAFPKNNDHNGRRLKQTVSAVTTLTDGFVAALIALRLTSPDHGHRPIDRLTDRQAAIC